MSEWCVVCHLQILLIIPNIKTKCLRSGDRNVIWLKWDIIEVLVSLYDLPLKKNVRIIFLLSRTYTVYICVSLRKITHPCANIKLVLTFVFLCTYKCTVKSKEYYSLSVFIYIPPVIAKTDLCNWSWNPLWWNWNWWKYGKLVEVLNISVPCGSVRSGVQHKHCQKSCDSCWRS